MILTFHLAQSKSTVQHICLTAVSQANNHVMFNFKTPFTISEKDWDREKQRPKNIYCKKYKEMNVLLIRLRVGLTRILEAGRQGEGNMTKKQITDELKKICSGKRQSYPKDSLLFMVAVYLQDKKNAIRLSTYRRYMVFLRLIEKFEGYRARQIYMKEIDSELIRTFHAFGKTEDYNESTIARTVHFIKTILHFAERMGLETPTGIRSLELPKTNTSTRVIILSEQEIVKIKDTQVPKELQRAKDWLLISCYTGQRVSDFMRFGRENLMDINGKVCLSFVQQKTGKEITIPLHPEVLGVVSRNGNCFPESMDISMYNDHLKRIAALAQLNETVKARKRTGYRSRDMLIEKWKIISSHIGRRSFASNFYGKIPTPLLMQATGHTSEQMFLSYINPVNYERIATLGSYFEKIYAERI